MNTNKMHEAIKLFEFYAKPRNGDSSTPCTNKDLNKVIMEVSKLAKTIINELEIME